MVYRGPASSPVPGKPSAAWPNDHGDALAEDAGGGVQHRQEAWGRVAEDAGVIFEMFLKAAPAFHSGLAQIEM
ncbi:hypothetical protein llap_15479 [Limosa lapponica baueri]|uniref:Uncharacterized protein n=1 Tax=Limosa lapponica baueri TaxID=1758121 RepID=A0A2I0TK89_LIMLA|nr:hypothetical protein llap_15479 [Limosa lapponica baueri]